MQSPFAGAGYQARRVRGIGGLGASRLCYTHNNTVSSSWGALMERLYYVKAEDGSFVEPPKPRRSPSSILGAFRQQLVSRITPPPVVPLAEVPLWFSGSRRKRMARAVENIGKYGVRQRDHEVVAFPKAEKWWKKSVCRLIQGPTAEYVVMVARFLKPLEHLVFEAIDDLWRGPTVMKGYDLEKRGQVIHKKWAQFLKPRGIGMDASRFDQHVSVPMLKWEHSVYNSIFKDACLAELLLDQISYRGTIRCPDGVIKYKSMGKRRSGDLNTSLGNILIMCAMAYELVKSVGLVPGKDVVLVNDGDDCVFMCEDYNVDALRAAIPGFYKDLGFTMVVEDTVDVLEHVEFCQARPVEVHGSYVMVRNPAKALQHDVQMVKPANFNAQEWCVAVGLCGLHVSSGVPVLQEFYKAMTMGRTESKVMSHVDFRREAVAYSSGGHTRKERSITDATRVSFWRAWGLDPTTQEIYEDLYRQAKPDFSLDCQSIDFPGSHEKSISDDLQQLNSHYFNN